MAVVAARERARVERGITGGEIVLPVSAHAAFHKAAHYFGLTVRPVPVDAGWRADVEAAAEVVNDRTVLVVGSAPQYPQGVVDPIPELAALARGVGASFHTDACMGGFVLPFMERLGEPVPPWDFRVGGVTTISADIHKLGYAPKGASVVLHRSKKLRSYQTFLFDDWLGGFYGSPNMQGTRLGMPMATAWAVLHHIGLDGYLRLTRETVDATRQIADGVRRIAGLRLLAEPAAHLLAIGSDGVDVFTVGDGLHAAGWHVDRQGPPDSLHLTVSAGNVPVVREFLADLEAAADEARGARGTARSTSYAGTD
jgi:glutamate/tyrosine decarboxylase-like PLP-dependent enzyme